MCAAAWRNIRIRQSRSPWSGCFALRVSPFRRETLAVTEVMYNPPGSGSISGDEFEFLELKNTGTNQLDLSGLSFSAGLSIKALRRSI